MIRKFLSYLEYQVNLPKISKVLDSAHLDLGCGSKPRNPFSATQLYGTDFSIFSNRFTNGVQFVAADLTRPLPFESDTFTSLSAYDVLEHIPRWERLSDGSIVFPFVNLMQEIYRVLKVGGIFYAVTPGYPSNAAFQDPTHINFISLETLSYFSGDTAHAANLGYGFTGKFEVLHNAWLRGAGPYAEYRISLFSGDAKARTRDSIRLFHRIYRLFINRNPEHILWVIKKS